LKSYPTSQMPVREGSFCQKKGLNFGPCTITLAPGGCHDRSEDKGFTVKDRRFFQQSEEEKERSAEESGNTRRLKKLRVRGEQSRRHYRPQAEGPAPEITFASFLMSLGTSVFSIWEICPTLRPGSRKKSSLAKQTIDLLGLLREKKPK